jgi:AraC-like DNA-binding protein
MGRREVHETAKVSPGETPCRPEHKPKWQSAPTIRLLAVLSPCGHAGPARLPSGFTSGRKAAHHTARHPGSGHAGTGAIAILPMFQEPSTATALLLETIALAFHAHVIHRYGDGLGSETSISTGLAPWQLRRACAFIDAHLCDDPSVSELVRECRLSTSHFARAFRQSTAMAPHRWIMKRRVERAKEMFLEGELELVQIALTCGFSDQSHFTRNFGRSEGHSPGKSRRVRRN